MESSSEDVICGVCSKSINDPYKLPCGHTFCLRPCLLAHAKSVKARCIYCHLEFWASELRQDYSVEAKLHSKLFEKSQMENNEETTKSANSRNRNGQTQCSACRKPMEAQQLDYCQHCYRSVCHLCLVQHFDSFGLSLRVKLTALARQKLSLSSKLQQLKNQSRTQLVSSHPTSKDTIVAEIDGAIAQLNRAVSDALDNAMSKLELLDDEGSRKLNKISKMLLVNCCNLDDIHDIYNKLEGNQMKLQDLARSLQRLKSIQDCAALTEGLPILPITLLEVSTRFYKIIEDIAEFSLLVLDDPAVLSTIISSQPASCDRVDFDKTGISKVKLFVGGLRATLTEEHLKRHFERSYGPLVDCCVARDHKTKVSRCHGFVTFKEPVHAARALEDFPHFIEGTPVQVRPYRIEKVERNKPSTERKGTAENVPVTAGSQLIIHDIPVETSRQDLLKSFSTFGGITSLRIDDKRRVGFLNFSSAEAIKLALESSPHQINGNDVRVSVAKASIGNTSQPTLKIQVGDISSITSSQDLVAFFAKFGEVLEANVVTKDYKRFGFVKMSSYEAVKSAMNAKAPKIKGNYVTIRAAFSKPQAISRGSRVRRSKANKKSSEITTTNKSIDSNPVKPQEIAIPVPSQEQPIGKISSSNALTGLSGPSTSTDSSSRKPEPSKDEKYTQLLIGQSLKPTNSFLPSTSPMTKSEKNKSAEHKRKSAKSESGHSSHPDSNHDDDLGDGFSNPL